MSIISFELRHHEIVTNRPYGRNNLSNEDDLEALDRTKSVLLKLRILDNFDGDDGSYNDRNQQAC